MSVQALNTAFNASFIRSWPKREPIPVEAWADRDDGRYLIRAKHGPVLAVADTADEAWVWIMERRRLVLRNEDELLADVLLA